MEEPGPRRARRHIDITLRRFAAAAMFGLASAVSGGAVAAVAMRGTPPEPEVLAVLRDEQADEQVRLAGLAHLARTVEEFCAAAKPVARSSTPGPLRDAARLALERIADAAKR